MTTWLGSGPARIGRLESGGISLKLTARATPPATAGVPLLISTVALRIEASKPSMPTSETLPDSFSAKKLLTGPSGPSGLTGRMTAMPKVTLPIARPIAFEVDGSSLASTMPSWLESQYGPPTPKNA